MYADDPRNWCGEEMNGGEERKPRSRRRQSASLTLDHAHEPSRRNGLSHPALLTINAQIFRYQGQCG